VAQARVPRKLEACTHVSYHSLVLHAVDYSMVMLLTEVARADLPRGLDSTPKHNIIRQNQTSAMLCTTKLLAGSALPKAVVGGFFLLCQGSSLPTQSNKNDLKTENNWIWPCCVCWLFGGCVNAHDEQGLPPRRQQSPLEPGVTFYMYIDSGLIVDFTQFASVICCAFGTLGVERAMARTTALSCTQTPPRRITKQ